MGMDVFGKNPTSDRGTYFRNNIWWWHPLWRYCEEVAPHVIPRHNLGHSNDGWGLNAAKARALAEVLEAELASGRTRAYAEARQQELEALPDEPCTVCGGTGKRRPPPETGPGTLECNACKGTGSHRPWVREFPFNEDNVREFVAFLRDCGGFAIR